MIQVKNFNLVGDLGPNQRRFATLMSRRKAGQNESVSKISSNFNSKANSVLLRSSKLANRHDLLPKTPHNQNTKRAHPRRRLYSFSKLLFKLAVLVHQIQCSTSTTSLGSSIVNSRHGQYVATLDAATRVVAAADELDLQALPSDQSSDQEDGPELAPVGRKYERNAAAATAENVASSPGGNHLIEFLESLPVSSVGQKRTAQFECDLRNEEANDTTGVHSESSSLKKLVWLKLVRLATLDTPNSTQVGVSAPANDITPLSLDKRIITPDKRFRVRHQPPSRWVLSIENVSLADDKAYFLCQVSGGGGGSGTTNQNFLGGGRLNVLMPPRIVDSDTSPDLVLASEFSPLKLQCKVISEQQSQISWRREDGQSLDGLELRFKHQLERRPHQLLSIDSSELLFGPVRREQAGAYLCIASNGVQPGVSQRISVVVENCRDSDGPEGKPEQCRDLREDSLVGEADEPQTPPPEPPTTTTTPSTTASASTTTAGSTRGPSHQMATQQQQQNRSTKRTWTTTSVRANANTTVMATRRQQTGDKSGRTSRYNNNNNNSGNNRESVGKRITTQPPVGRGESDNESNGSRGSSLSFVVANQIGPVLVCALICAVRSIAPHIHFH